MAYQATNHKVVRRFDVEIERHDNEEKDKRYRASCKGLTGCQVHANSKARALRKIRQAIDVWLDLADRQLGDDVSGIRDMIDMNVPD